jgi:hypothetical protein
MGKLCQPRCEAAATGNSALQPFLLFMSAASFCFKLCVRLQPVTRLRSGLATSLHVELIRTMPDLFFFRHICVFLVYCYCLTGHCFEVLLVDFQQIYWRFEPLILRGKT